MLIILSLVLSIILNIILFSSSLKIINTLIDISIFRNISSLESSLLLIPLFIIVPTVSIYYLLRKLNFDQKLQNMKVVKIIFSILLTFIILYIVIILLSTTVEGGGLTFGLKMIFGIYVLPIIILLFIISASMIIYRLVKSRKNTYINIAFSKKEINFIKYITVLSIVIIFTTTLNPYGSVIKNFQTNDVFKNQCQNAKTTINEKIVLDSVFLYTSSQNRYCKIDSSNNYSSYGGGLLPYPRIVIDSNVTFEIFNRNKKDNNNFPYKYYDNKSEENYRNGVESKVLKSKYGYIEKQIYNKDLIYGSSVEIFKIDNNATIAKSIYYVNKKTKKVCGELIRPSKYKYEGKCLKPVDLLLDMINIQQKD